VQGAYEPGAGYGAPNYDTTPDGTPFVVSFGRDALVAPSSQVIVVLNWVIELRARLPAP